MVVEEAEALTGALLSIRARDHPAIVPTPRAAVAKGQKGGRHVAGLRDWSCGLVEESVDSFHRARHASSRVFQFQWPDAATSNATGLVEATRWAIHLCTARLTCSICGDCWNHLAWLGICQQGRCWHGAGAEVDRGDGISGAGGIGSTGHLVTVFGSGVESGTRRELQKSGPVSNRDFIAVH